MMQQDHLLLYSNMQDLIIIVPLPPVPHQKIPTYHEEAKGQFHKNEVDG